METRRERVARLAREGRADARAKKLCQLCPKSRRRPVRPGKSTCVECAGANARRQRDDLREQKRAGRCSKYRCPNPRAVGSLCVEHDRKKKAYPSHGTNVTVERRASENLCREGCGRSAYDRSRCSECSGLEVEKAKQRKAERIAAGLCYRCGKRRAPPEQGVSRVREEASRPRPRPPDSPRPARAPEVWGVRGTGA